MNGLVACGVRRSMMPDVRPYRLPRNDRVNDDRGLVHVVHSTDMRLAHVSRLRCIERRTMRAGRLSRHSRGPVCAVVGEGLLEARQRAFALDERDGSVAAVGTGEKLLERLRIVCG